MTLFQVNSYPLNLSLVGSNKINEIDCGLLKDTFLIKQEKDHNDVLLKIGKAVGKSESNDKFSPLE